MTSVQACELPDTALLHRYVRAGAYTDCYATSLGHSVSQTEFIEAFYTTAVFKLERWILANLVSRPSTDEQARELATGERTTFAAWSVEAREPDQLLLCDYQGRTRSWLMAQPDSGPNGTRLYFGSAVVPIEIRDSGKTRMGFGFSALLGFHRLYSRILLQAAVTRLSRAPGS